MLNGVSLPRWQNLSTKTGFVYTARALVLRNFFFLLASLLPCLLARTRFCFCSFPMCTWLRSITMHAYVRYDDNERAIVPVALKHVFIRNIRKTLTHKERNIFSGVPRMAQWRISIKGRYWCLEASSFPPHFPVRAGWLCVLPSSALKMRFWNAETKDTLVR